MGMVFSDLIRVVINKEDRGVDYCVYSDLNIDKLELNMEVWIDRYPDIDDDSDEEIFPTDNNGHEYFLMYRDELIQDVVEESVRQKSNATLEEIANAIDYYSKNDNFLSLSC